MLKWLWISVLVVILDQVTKQLAESRLAWGEPVEIYSWFNLILAYNRGAAFSFLNDAAGWQRWFFIIIGGVAVVVILFWMRRLSSGEHLTATSLALILGGAVGNLIDRFLYGHVVDFIQWHYQEWYWPAFNIADSAITVGVTFLIAGRLVARRGDDA
jgi:signal peptidase II